MVRPGKPGKGGDPLPDQFLISLLFRRTRGLARWGLASSLRRLIVLVAVDAFQLQINASLNLDFREFERDVLANSPVFASHFLKTSRWN